MAYNPPYLYSVPFANVDVVEVPEHEVEPDTEDPLPQMTPACQPCPLCNTMHPEEEFASKNTDCRCRFCHLTFTTREAWLEHYEGCLRHVSRENLKEFGILTQTYSYRTTTVRMRIESV